MNLFKTLLFLLAISFCFAVPQAQAAFSDLPDSHHHSFPLNLLAHYEIIQGYQDGTVRPAQSINRAELIKILVEGLELISNPNIHNSCFPDVSKEWFAQYICFAKEQGWVDGYPDGTFKPGQTINKVEALKIILSAFDMLSGSGSARFFSDTSEEEWYSPYLRVALQKELLEEAGGNTFAPGNLRNRGEVAEMVARIIMIRKVGDQKYTKWLRAEFQNFLYLHELRRQEGVFEKLTINPVLTKVARAHAKDMGDNIKELSHGSSDGITQSFDRIKDAMRTEDDPGFGGRTGENIGGGSTWAQNDPFQMIKWVHDNIFMPEDPNVCNHRTTLLSQCLPFTEVGIGVYVNAEGQAFFVNDFITRVYADTMGMRVGLELPAEYSNTAEYTIVDQEETYVTIVTNDCNAAKVRAQYFVNIGVFRENGNCRVYEHAWSRQPQWNEFRDYLNNEIFQIEYTSTYYTPERPSENDVFIAVRPTGTLGWEIVDHDNPNIPAYFDIGETANISFRNKNTSEVISFRIELPDGSFIISLL